MLRPDLHTFLRRRRRVFGDVVCGGEAFNPHKTGKMNTRGYKLGFEPGKKQTLWKQTGTFYPANCPDTTVTLRPDSVRPF